MTAREASDSMLLSGDDFRRRALARLPVEPPPPVLPSGIVPGGDHALNQRGLPQHIIAGARPAAVLVPVVLHTTGATILLTQRTAQMRKHSGQIAFPGGKVDEPGETALEAALRETREEIGLAARHIEPLGYLDPYFTVTGYRVIPVIAMVRPPFDLTPNADEVADVFEVPLDFLMEPANHHLVERKEDGRRFYAMPFGERYIWGATAGILRHLYERLYQ